MIKHNAKKALFDIEYAENYRIPKGALEHYNNSFYFSGFDNDDRRFLIRLAFRASGIVETWFAFKDEDGRVYNYDKHIDKPKKGLLSSGPITFELIEAGKKWKLSFKGKAKDGRTNKLVNIEFDGCFFSDKPIYDFGTMSDPSLMAEALAQEKWNKEFFKALRTQRQVHYEQFGEFEGKIKIGTIIQNLKMNALRDHSFGPRSWAYMKKHVWLVGVLEDGRCFNYSLVQYPAVKNLIAGFVINNEDITNVTGGTDLEYFPVEKRPNNFKLEVLLGKEKCPVVLEYNYSESLTWDLAGVYLITEGFAEFNFDGVKGKGIAEFGINKEFLEEEK